MKAIPQNLTQRGMRLAALIATLIAVWPSSSSASVFASAGSRACIDELSELSLEQLSSILVTSVSRRAERLSAASAAVYVISADDIRRAGATTLAEALRLAPNLDVARADANQYAISARGFNNITANDMLILIDGRTVYSPLFSGVFWEAQSVMMEDIERIEVISGPGATLWGANAVNGVINVLTRSARETQGSLFAAGGGNRESGVAIRHGGMLAGGHYRIYGQYRDQQPSRRDVGGGSLQDASNYAQFGFRADWQSARRTFTIQGDTYDSAIDQAPVARQVAGFNLLSRWTGEFEDGSRLRMQAYVDRAERNLPGVYADRLDTLDAELQYAFRPLGAHALMLGAGHRFSRDRFDNGPVTFFLPASRDLKLENIFIQDGVTLGPNTELTAGIKAERNGYTGVETLPNLRIAWRPSDELTFWSALSRAVRTPARLDRDYAVPGFSPNDDFRSEVSNVIEAGLRGRSAPTFTYSLTAFHHIHDRLRSVEPVAGHPGILRFDNKLDGTTTGISAWGTYQPARNWRLTGGVTYQNKDVRAQPGSGDTGLGIQLIGNDPRYWGQLRAAWDITPRHEFDLGVRHVGGRPNPQVPAYTSLDMRLGWRATDTLELSLVLKNLADERHPEWGNTGSRAEYERSAFLKVTWSP